jgi:Amt family ammonium transporter
VIEGREAVAVTILYSAVVTAIVFYIASALTGGARVDEKTQLIGPDEAVHGEDAIKLRERR